MKVKNESVWATKDLKKLFNVVCDKMGANKHWQKIRVKTSKGRYSGLASIGGCWVLLRIPSTKLITEEYLADDGRTNWLDRRVDIDHPDSIKIAQILMHEIGHNQSLRHREMADWWTFDCDWDKDFVINRKPVKEKIVIDLKEKRYTKTLQAIKKKETQIKRLQNSLKKLYTKKKYYEKKDVNA